MKRMLTATPQELVNCSARELLSAIKMAEGRTLRVGARIRANNLIDGVSNAEVVAAFGADIINLDTYDILNSNIPGWESKNPEDDIPFEEVQIKMGRGFSFREIEKIVGRPMSVLVLAASSQELANATSRAYGNIILSDRLLQRIKEEDVRIIQLDSFDENVNLSDAVRRIREFLGPEIIINVARSHGSGILNYENTKDLVNSEEVISLIKAGVDIIGFPSPGSYPGWDVEQCKKYVRLAHDYGAVVSLGVHTSQEGANYQTLEQIALYSKMCGADMHDLGDCGFNESIIDPMNILRYGVAIRGKRHHYRRMSFSNWR